EGQPDVLGVESRRRLRPVAGRRGRMEDQPPLEGEKHEEYPQIHASQQQNQATKASPPGALRGNLRSARDGRHVYLRGGHAPGPASQTAGRRSTYSLSPRAGSPTLKGRRGPLRGGSDTPGPTPIDLTSSRFSRYSRKNWSGPVARAWLTILPPFSIFPGSSRRAEGRAGLWRQGPRTPMT